MPEPARYLAAPVDRLRLATRQLASGDLNVRVLPALKGHQDDLVLLAADVDPMAERLRLLLAGKQQLLRDVSHELRSPLARLPLSLARRDPGATDRHLNRAGLEADRLEPLIARTLELVSLERAAHELERTSVEVGELLRSAFENLIRNAVRYSPAGASVSISARRTGSSADSPIEVVVRGEGPGVPQKDLALSFEPFYRVEAARKHRTGGEGLGLAIAARPIAVHGGRIEAANDGLLISVSLPAEVAAGSVYPSGPAVEA